MAKVKKTPKLPPVVSPPPHADSDRLARAIGRCLPLVQTVNDDFIRVTGYEYTTQYDLSRGEGSRTHGGRWNPMGWATLYASKEAATALEEMLAYYRHQGLPEIEATPCVWVGFHAKLQAALDLRNPEVRRRLGVSARQMKGEPWRVIQARGQEALTQAIGRLARLAGLEGLLVPSARAAGGTNLIVFPDRLRPGSVLVIHRANQLPARRQRKKLDADRRGRMML